MANKQGSGNHRPTTPGASQKSDKDSSSQVAQRSKKTPYTEEEHDEKQLSSGHSQEAHPAAKNTYQTPFKAGNPYYAAQRPDEDEDADEENGDDEDDEDEDDDEDDNFEEDEEEDAEEKSSSKKSSSPSASTSGNHPLTSHKKNHNVSCAATPSCTPSRKPGTEKGANQACRMTQQPSKKGHK